MRIYLPRIIPGFFLILVVFALSVAALWMIVNVNAVSNRGISWGETFLSNGEPIGINVALENEDQNSLDKSITVIKDGGYGSVRQAFPWREIEPNKGEYDWRKWDRLVSTFSDAGLKVIARLDQPPQWSRKDNNWINRPPDSLEDYTDFVKAFVTRYRGSVEYIQIWDEPNTFPNWGNRPVDAADYVELLKAAYTSAKSVNPNVKVLTAGLAPNTERGGRNMADTLFLQEMYRHGAKDYFDILAAKPYGLWNPPDDRRTELDVVNFSRLVLLREIMVKNGDDSKPIWAVEFGWNALPESWQGEPSVWGRVTEQEQADYTKKAIDRARREWPWLQGMLIQGFGPQYAPSNPLYGFSVVDSKLAPRPVYATIKAVAADPNAPMGVHLAGSRYIHYNGQWQVSEYGKLGKPGDSLTLHFEGTRVDAIIWRTNDSGIIEVTVDGKKQDLSPQLDSSGRMNLYSTDPRRAQLTLASGLSDGEHVLQLKVIEGQAGGESEAIIDRFMVIRDAPISREQIAFTLLLALQGGLIVWLVVAFPAFYHSTRLALQPLFSPLAKGGRRFEGTIGGLGDAWILLGMLVALVIFYFISSIPIAFAGLLLYALLAWARPDMGLLYVVFASPFYLLPKRFGNLQFSMSEVLILTCLAAFVLRKTIMTLADSPQAGRSAIRRNWLSEYMNSDGFALPALLFVLAGLLSLIQAERLQDGLRELRTIVIEPIILYWLLTNTLNTRKVSWLVNALIASALLLSVVGLYQYLFTSDVITAEGVRRAKAFFGSPNNLGLFLGRGLPLALCLGLFADISSRSRTFYLGSALIMGVTVILTFSVGAWLGLTAAFIVMFAFRSVRLAGAATAGAVGLAVVLPQILKLERITSRLDFEQGTVALRLLIWQAAVKMIQDHPLLGVGLDNFLNQYPRYMLAEAWREPNLSHPHNLVLDYWLRTGLLGLVAGLWLIARFFVVSARLYHRSLDVKIRLLALGLIGSVTDFVVHGLIDNSYFTIDLAIIFWTSLAAIKILEGEKQVA